MKIRRVVSVPFTCTLVVLLFVVLSSTTADEPLDPASIPFGMQGECVACDGCVNSQEHMAWVHQFGSRDGGDHGCGFETETCGSHHPTTCGVVPVDLLLEQARLSSQGDEAGLPSALMEGELSAYVAFNARRGAVQVLGCDGTTVIANFPVDWTDDS